MKANVLRHRPHSLFEHPGRAIGGGRVPAACKPTLLARSLRGAFSMTESLRNGTFLYINTLTGQIYPEEAFLTMTIGTVTKQLIRRLFLTAF